MSMEPWTWAGPSWSAKSHRPTGNNRLNEWPATLMPILGNHAASSVFFQAAQRFRCAAETRARASALMTRFFAISRAGTLYERSEAASFFSSELGVPGTMRLPNRKERTGAPLV
jgi:hypothetical protein